MIRVSATLAGIAQRIVVLARTFRWVLVAVAVLASSGATWWRSGPSGRTSAPPATVAVAVPTTAPASPDPGTTAAAVLVGWSAAALRTDGTPTRLDPCGPPLVIAYDATYQPYDAFWDIAVLGEQLQGALGHEVIATDVALGPPPAGVVVSVGWVPTSADLIPGGMDPFGTGIFEAVDGIITGGTVQLISYPPTPLTAGLGSGSWGSVAAHELAHVVGLGHVDQSDALMNPTPDPTVGSTYGPGELAGLAAVGGPCPPTP